MTEKRKDLFKNTYRSSMALTIDYVFHAVFGRDTDESKAALMEILNIILERKDDPIMSIVLKNPINTAAREDEKETIMDIRAETSSGEAAGRQEMKLELARAMKAKGMETEVIAEITGLPAAEI